METYDLTTEQIDSLNILNCLESTLFVSIGNMIGGAVLWDTIFGSLATLIGAFFTYFSQ